MNCMKQASLKGKRLSPIKLNPEVELVGLVTFLVSIASLGWHVSNYLQGPQIEVFPPDQIVIGRSDKVDFPNRDRGPHFHVVGRMSYANKGAAGYNAIIQRARLIISIPNHEEIEHRWYRFVSTDSAGDNGGALIVTKLSDAGPFPVTAGSSESHQMLFQPWPKDCGDQSVKCHAADNYLDWDRFVDLLEPKGTMTLTFLADVFGESEPATAVCKIVMKKKHIKLMSQRKWASPVCR